MKMSTLSSQFHLLKCPTKYLARSASSNPSFFIPISQQKPSTHPAILSSLPSEPTNTLPPTLSYVISKSKPGVQLEQLSSKLQKPSSSSNYKEASSKTSRFLIMGAVSVGVAMLLMGMDEQKAMALGPEGPLVEEFWDNVRRYGLYALTVSTGALYATFQPIYELLKNPISAILVLVILGGGIFIFSQVLYAMVGVSDFTYDYSS